MSNISKALKKIQELRDRSQPVREDTPGSTEIRQAPKTEIKINYSSDTVQEGASNNSSMVLIYIGILLAIVIGITAILLTIRTSAFKQNKVENLEKNILMQQKRLNELITAINKNQKIFENQTHHLDTEVAKENSSTKSLIDNATSTEEIHYSTIKEAILDDKEKIKTLEEKINTQEENAKNLNQEIINISTKQKQMSDLLSPATSN